MNLLASGRPWEEATMTDPHFHAFVMQDTDVFNPIGEQFPYSFILNMLCPEYWRMTASQVLEKIV
jgi:hypothetical protein